MKHVAYHAGFLVVPSARFNADVLCRSDLNVMNPLPIPQRLEDRIRETEDEDVLYSFLAEVMIDTKDLMLGEEAQDKMIQIGCRLEVAPKWLLDDDTHPRSDALVLSARRQSAR